MNKLLNNPIYNKKYFQKILIISLLGFFLGIIFFKKLSNETLLNEILNIENLLTNTHINYLPSHFLILSFLSLASLIGLYSFIVPLYLIFEFACISYNILIFTSSYHFKGLIYSLIYNLLTKGFYLILILIIIKKIRILIHSIFKTKETYNNSLIINIKSIKIYLILMILNDILIYLFGSNILLKLSFLLNT